jgi:hypothetical protein
MFKMKAKVAEMFVMSANLSPPLAQHSLAYSNKQLATSSCRISSFSNLNAKKKPCFLCQFSATIRAFGISVDSPMTDDSKWLMLSLSGTLYSCKTISKGVGKNFNTCARVKVTIFDDFDFASWLLPRIRVLVALVCWSQKTVSVGRLFILGLCHSSAGGLTKRLPALVIMQSLPSLG